MRTTHRALITVLALAASAAFIAPSAAFASQHDGDGGTADSTSASSAPATEDQGSATSDDSQSAEAGDDTAAGNEPGEDQDAPRDTTADDGDAPVADAVASVDHVRARLTAFDTARVTWRLSRTGTAPASFEVQLVPQNGATLSATVDGGLRAADIAGLAGSTRYDVLVSAIGGDGVALAAMHGEGVRTKSTDAAVRDTKRAAKTADAVAKAAAKEATRAAATARHAGGRSQAIAARTAKKAKQRADRAAATARNAHREAMRARHQAESEAAND